MKAVALIAALNLPPESRVDRRVPKKLLLENGAPTAADRRKINEGIEELFWLAALKPTTTGVPEYRDEVREYLEIAVLSLTLRRETGAGRLVELIHRAIPYPLLLITEHSGSLTMSMAHKRWSQGEEGKVVLDDAVIVCDLVQHIATSAFLDSLSLARQPRTNLRDLYNGWICNLEAFQAALVTNRFELYAGHEAIVSRRAAIAEHETLIRQIDILRAQTERESQINRRVELNLEIKRLKTKLSKLKSKL